MAGSFSDYLEAKLQDYVWGGVAFTPASTLYVGLSTADPTDSGSGIAEPAGGSYARVAVTKNQTNWPACHATSGLISNGTAITFPKATASWGIITHFFISDDDGTPTGNMYVHGSLTNSKTVDIDDTVSFAVGELDITLG